MKSLPARALPPQGLFEGEGDDVVSALEMHLSVPARTYDNVLLTGNAVRCSRRIDACARKERPEDLTGLGIVGAEPTLTIPCEYQPAGGRQQRARREELPGPEVVEARCRRNRGTPAVRRSRTWSISRSRVTSLQRGGSAAFAAEARSDRRSRCGSTGSGRVRFTKSSTVVAKRTGSSRYGKCPAAGNTASWLPLISAWARRACSTGISGSRSPQMIRVGRPAVR